MVYKSGSDPKASDQPALTHAIKTMPRWKWRLLALGLVIGCIGVAGQATHYFKYGSAPGTPVAVQPTAASRRTAAQGSPAGSPQGSSGFVSAPPATPDQPTAPAPDPSPSASPQASSSFWTPFMTRVGFSLFVGMVVGLIFRTFFRVAILISALIVSAAMALSYFHVVNLDMSAVKEGTTHATNWLSDEGYRLRDMLFHALPSSTSAGIGFLLGFKRR